MNIAIKHIRSFALAGLLLFGVFVCIPSDVFAGGLISDGLQADIDDLNQVGDTTPEQLFGVALGSLFTVIGAIVLLMVVVGGIMLMTARGNSEQMGKAIKTLVWTALGTFVVFSAMALTRFVVQIFSNA